MLRSPFFQVFFPRLLGPALDRITLWLWSRILRSVGQGRILDNHRALCAVESDELSTIIVQVAAHRDAEVGIVVESLDEIGELAAILEMEKAAGGLGALRNRVRAGDELDPGNQVNKQVATQPLAVIRKTPPAEEAHRVKGTLRCAVEKRIPVDSRFIRIRSNRIHPGTARTVAVPVCLDRRDLSQPARVIDFLSLGVEDRTDALAANLHDAISFVSCRHHG